MDTDETQIYWDSLEDQPFHAYALWAKVEKKANLYASSLQVVQQLGFVGSHKGVSGLDLADNLAVNENISIEQADGLAFVANFDLRLTNGGKAIGLQFAHQSGLVDFLQKARPELSVHLKGGADDLLGQLPMGILRLNAGRGSPFLCPICVHLWLMVLWLTRQPAGRVLGGVGGDDGGAGPAGGGGGRRGGGAAGAATRRGP